MDTITLTEGDLLITDAVTITGPGWDELTIDASGIGDPNVDGDGARVFTVDAPGPPTPFSVSISGLSLTGGDPAGEGGALLAELGVNRNASINLEGLRVFDNVAETAGGGIRVASSRDIPIVMTDLLVEGNRVYGGAPYRINTVEAFGGGIAVESAGVMTLDRLLVRDNAVYSPSGVDFENGGGIAIIDGDSTDTGMRVVLSDTYVVGNSAGSLVGVDPLAEDQSGRGGGVYVEPRSAGAQPEVRFDGVVLEDNDAGGSGGGLFIRPTGFNGVQRFEVINSLVIDNRAATGGGVSTVGSAISLRHSTVARNTAGWGSALTPARGGGVYAQSGTTGDSYTMRLDHAIIADNSLAPGVLDPSVVDPNQHGADVAITFLGSQQPANWTNSWIGTVADTRPNGLPFPSLPATLSTGDPELASMTIDTGEVFFLDTTRLPALPLESTSLAIDAGDPALTAATPPAYAVVGVPQAIDADLRAGAYSRVFDVADTNNGGVIDLGSFESQPAATPTGPRVLDVMISTTDSRIEDPQHRYSDVVGGVRTGAQLDPAPVRQVDTITLRFDRPIDLTDLPAVEDALTVFGALTDNRPSVVSMVASGDRRTLSWTLVGWGLGDHYAIRLDDTAINDDLGGALDGEWTNPIDREVTSTSVSTFPSGDGVAGGAFVFAATLLPGDFDLDGDVDVIDFGVFANNFGLEAVEGYLDGDFEGDGDVDVIDFGVFADEFGKDLGGPINLLADLDADGLDVDAADEALINTLGDFDGDGDIDAADLDFFYGWSGFRGVA